MFKSIMWKFVYGAVVTILGVLTGYVNANPDPQGWAIAAVIGGSATALVAFVKKFAFNAVTGGA